MTVGLTPHLHYDKEGAREPPEDVRTVAVLGAGSSGLVAAKHLKDAGYDVTILEAQSALGGAFRDKAYDGARLVSSTHLTAFSDLRFNDHSTPHVSLERYVDYLDEYADTFRLKELVRWNTRVEAVARKADGSYVVTVLDETEAFPVGSQASDLSFDAVCVCCGVHSHPYVPHIEGVETFTGTLLHSAEYKTRDVFRGKKVLVLGCGESGMDLAYRAVHEADSVAISIRNGMLAVPHEGWGGQPLDTLICNLCEHSYEARWLHDIHLKWRITTLVIRVMFFLMTGTSSGYSQYTGHVREVKRGHHILCKSTAALPYINRPFKKRSWKRFVPLWWWAEPAVEREIASFPAPSRIDGGTVSFSDGTTLENVDLIVFATGYQQRWPFLISRRRCGGDEPAGARGIEDPLPSQHLIVDPSEPRLAFLGFVRPNVGAIPPMAELQAMWWIERLRGRIPARRSPPSYGLLGRKLAYGVDYGNYMHQLAAEFGAAPSLTTLYSRSWSALASYCLGQAYISFFRLQGPFATAEAWRVAETELLRTVTQRGLLTNGIFVLTLAAFGALNMGSFFAERLFRWAFGTLKSGRRKESMDPRRDEQLSAAGHPPNSAPCHCTSTL